MKTQPYNALLKTELDKMEARVGRQKIEELSLKLRQYRDEALCRELLVQLIATEFKLLERIAYLVQRPQLILPYLFRIKQPATENNDDNERVPR